MSNRELVVLGTASQAPTRYRNHNGYFLRWDSTGFMFDPGEGTQRQMILAGVASADVDLVAITHFHGDHCLGLPGLLQRRSLDRVSERLDVYFPAEGSEYLYRLRHASLFRDVTNVAEHPVEGPSVSEIGPVRISGRPLDHSTPTVGWRIDEPDGVRMLPERLRSLGISGPDVGRLQREGRLLVGDRTVTLAEVSEHRGGQSFAFVMDTRPCEAAVELARGVDLLVCEATFLTAERDLAEAYGHMTAAQAAALARDAGARRLVLTHFSQRHPDERSYLDEASAIFGDVVAARDLDVVEVPKRR